MAIKQRINIYDTDTTTITGGSEDVYDIAFIPGLTNKYLNCIVGSGEPIAPTSETKAEFAYDTKNQVKYQKDTHDVLATFAIDTYELAAQEISYDGQTYTIEAQNIALSGISVAGTTPTVADIIATIDSGVGGYILDYSITAGTPDTYKCTIYTTDGSTVTSDDIATATVVYDEATTATQQAAANDIQYSISDSLVTFHKCSSGYQTDALYWKALDDNAYDYIGGQIIRYNSFAAFISAIGNEPLSVWTYKVEGEDEAEKSFLSLYDFAATKSSDKTKVGINTWIRNNLKSDDAISVGDVDKSWLYAAELLKLGLPVFYYAFPVTSEDSAVDFDFNSKFVTSGVITDEAQKMYADLADKGEFNIKYLTTGGFDAGIDIVINDISLDKDTESGRENIFTYPFYSADVANKTLVSYLADIANYRKDCMVEFDVASKDCLKSLNPADPSSAYSKIEELVLNNELVNYYNDDSYSAEDAARQGRRLNVTFPWYKADCDSFPRYMAQYRKDGTAFVMPGSFAYLISLADALNKYESASWEAIAGVTRANIPNFVSLYVDERLTNAIADAYNLRNRVGINAITNIRPYGYCIWGNRTLTNNEYFAGLGNGEDGLVASSFVDIMSMVCNINKVAFRACKRLMFEKDNDKLWVRFMQAVSPYMDQLISGGALKNYEIQKQPSKMRGQLVAKIIVWPYYAVENFDIEIVLRDTEATTES